MAHVQLCDRERLQVMVPGQARSSSQGMSSWDTSTAETAAYNPLHKKGVCSNIPFCSISKSGMETIMKALKTSTEGKKKGPGDSNQRLFQEVSSLLA